ncbi:MAG: hypothetical protein KKF65_02660 [Nanoarchaeota archaeon]|nr:hypothetical protein [Nanoarchaeota archaeon]
MKQKQIGIILIILAIILSIFTYTLKAREEKYINNIIHETGSCFLSDGTCLHADRNIYIYIIGWAMSIAIGIFGIYLIIDKTDKTLAEQQVIVTHALNEAKKNEKEKDEFKAFLTGFEEDQQKVLKAVKEQEGIKQSTLRYRTDMSKTTLSLLLKKLEERKIIKRKPSGKTNEVYLIKKF